MTKQWSIWHYHVVVSEIRLALVRMLVQNGTPSRVADGR